MPADLIYDNMRSGIADGSISWTGDTIMVVLVLADTYTPDAGDQFVADVLAAGAVEAASTGDRQTITTPAVNLDGTLHRAFLTGDPIAYPNVTNGTAFDALIAFKFVTDDTDSLLLGLYSLPGGLGDGTDVDLTPNANGYYEL